MLRFGAAYGRLATGFGRFGASALALGTLAQALYAVSDLDSQARWLTPSRLAATGGQVRSAPIRQAIRFHHSSWDTSSQGFGAEGSSVGVEVWASTALAR